MKTIENACILILLKKEAKKLPTRGQELKNSPPPEQYVLWWVYHVRKHWGHQGRQGWVSDSVRNEMSRDEFKASRGGY